MPHIMEMHNLPSELLQYRPQAQGLPLVHTCVQAVAYLEGGASASQPPPPFGRTVVIFVTILGLF